MIFLKIRFLKGLEDMSLNFLHKDQEAIRMPMLRVRKTASTLLIDAILSVISGFITEQCISAIDCAPLFSLLEK